MLELTPAQRRDLKAKAHHLHPVVSVSSKGLTDSVLHEIDASLQAHELIKIRVYGADRAVRTELMASVCDKLAAAPVQSIGNLLVVWRQRQEREAEETTAPATPAKTPGGATLKSAKAFAQAARRRVLAAAAAEQRQRAARRPAGRRTGPQRSSRG